MTPLETNIALRIDFKKYETLSQLYFNGKPAFLFTYFLKLSSLGNYELRENSNKKNDKKMTSAPLFAWLNTFTANADFYYLTLANARRFYSPVWTSWQLNC